MDIVVSTRKCVMGLLTPSARCIVTAPCYYRADV